MKIFATVVTYNRLPLLKECIEAIRKQTRPVDAIIVVNNGSTDGTTEWLNEQKDIIAIHQDNVGSGGGQNRAFKEAYYRQADWIWTMDDDGYAQTNTLEKLIEAIQLKNDIRVINSVVIKKQDPSCNALCFPQHTFIKNKKYIFYTLAEIRKHTQEKIIEGVPNFFNSSLIHRSVVEQIGFPLKELFILGDEVEYNMRMMNANIKMYVATESLYLHPQNDFFFKFFHKNVYFPISENKLYYLTRNYTYIRKKYKCFSKAYSSNFFVTKLFIKLIILSLMKKVKFKDKFKIIVKALKDSRHFAPLTENVI
ncbi:MAG: glycosyltransferase [Raineya sp.]|nr:glycosyltransferase [Raineya sp.]MDW8296968.1 glycosyltransferase [Raineya sp.]